MSREERSAEETLGAAFEQAKEYVNLRVELAKTEAAEKIAKASGSVGAAVVILLTVFFFLLFASVMAGFYFSGLLHSYFYGFGIVAAFYLVLLLVLAVAKKGLIEKPVADRVVRLLFDKENDA